MTAEVAILNKSAVALAADSAVTVTRIVKDKETGESKPKEKVYNSIYKLFELSKYKPVGIMVYGNASFLGVPWESIIKIFREELGRKEFDRLEGYVKELIRYLHKRKDLFPEGQQIKYVEEACLSYLYSYIYSELVAAVGPAEKLEDKEKAAQAIVEITKREEGKLDNLGFVVGMSKKQSQQILKKYRDNFSAIIGALFDGYPISDEVMQSLLRICSSIFCKRIFYPSNSGIVIAGFGKKETFPSVVSFELEGMINDKLKHTKLSKYEITHEDESQIIPFAQKEMVDTFVKGLHPAHEEYLADYLEEVYSEIPKLFVEQLQGTPAEKKALAEGFNSKAGEIIKKFQQKFDKYVTEEHVEPVFSATAALPIDELATMAESLVSLTNFKQRVSIDTETVGGPIDVGVISKGDGFIWIKRKSYFKNELNPNFYHLYFEGEHGQKEQKNEKDQRTKRGRNRARRL